MAMKIERISDNQIKFILTESDLSQRNMRLHELSYGSEKAQELFREIMERATVECNFHTTNETPLIIEAIPVSRDGIMIIVTKVARSEDLEERFGYPPVLGDFKNGARQMQKKKPDADDAAAKPPKNAPKVMPPAKQIIFEFLTLENVTSGAARLHGNYAGGSALYKHNAKYYLVIENDHFKLSAAQENILKEYSNKFSSLDISKMFLLEHGEIIVDKNAIGILSAYLG